MIKTGKTPSWNFGKISRQRAEQLLLNESIGTFLVRESEHFPGDLTLSIRDEDRIQHYRIKLDLNNRSYTVDDEMFLSDLNLLVQVSRFLSEAISTKMFSSFSTTNLMLMDCVVV